MKYPEKYPVKFVGKEPESFYAKSDSLRKKDILLSDGRQLVFYTNNPIPALPAGETQENNTLTVWQVDCINNFNINVYLARRGVLSIPEIDPTAEDGKRLDSHMAFYVDHRIGTAKVSSLTSTSEWYERRRQLGPLAGEIIPARELAELLDRGIEETGIGEILKQMRAEDAARAQEARTTPDLDLREVMKHLRD